MRARKPCWLFRVRFERCRVRFINKAATEAAKSGYIMDMPRFVNAAALAGIHTSGSRHKRIASSGTLWNNGAT